MRSIIMSNLSITNLNSLATPRLKSCALAVQLATSKLSGFKVKPLGMAALALSMSTSVFAEQEVDIKAQPLATAIKDLAQKSGVQIGYNAKIVLGKNSSAVKGVFTTDEVLKKLLKGSGLTAIKKTSSSYVVKNISDSGDNVSGTLALTTVGSQNRFGDGPQEQGGFKADYQKTATKMAMSLKETPQAISVVTRDSLDARLVKNLASAVELTAGINNIATENGGAKASPGMFAGQGQYDTNFLLRGQPSIVRSDGFLVGNTGVDLAAYERVEVVKGAAGFYGQGSLGGFINMVRKKPGSEFSANVNVQAGSFDTYRTDIDARGALNQDETLTGHVSMAYEDAGSFVDKLHNKRMMLAPSIEATINEKTRILTQLLYQKDEFDSNGGIPLELDGDRLKRWDNLDSRTELYGETGDKSETEVSEVIVKVDHQLSERWLASLQLQTNKSTRDIIEGNSASAYDYGYGVYIYTTATKDLWEQNFWAGELRLEGSFNAFNQEHKVLIGAEHNDQRRDRKFGSSYTQIGLAESFDGNFSDYGFLTREDISTSVIRNDDSHNNAVYAQVVFSLQEKTKLLISGRYDNTHSKLDWTTDSGQVHNGDAVQHDEFTKRIGLTHAFNDNISVYAVYAESFQPSDAIGRNGILDPITGEGYELGFKTDWFNNKIGASLALYQQDLSNRPVEDPSNARLEDGTMEDFSISSGLHRTEGVELEVNGSPYLGVTLSASASWQDNEFLNDDNNQGLSINGSIDNQFNLYTSYQWQTGVFKGLELGATFINVGERKFIDEGSQIYLDGYNRADLHLSYNALPNWDVSLLIRNVTDENYIESVNTWYNGNFRGSPRAVLLNVAYHFE